MTVVLRTRYVCFILVLLATIAGVQPNLHAGSPTLEWELDAASEVTGFAVTVDGVRQDYGLAPLSAAGTCGCAIPLPISGGVHTIVVSAYNRHGETAAEPLFVAPVASAGGPYNAAIGAALLVNGSGSNNPAGTITTYDWDWGDGTKSTTSVPQTSHVYTIAGFFRVTLVVTDNAGATAVATTTATISGARAPLVSITSPANGSTFPSPATFTVSANASDPDGAVTKVDFFASGAPIATDLAAPFTAVLRNLPSGTYVLTAVATDNSGLTASTSATISVTSPAAATPFGGTALVIPAVVQAENFDNGGEGIAYHDRSPRNTGGVYRDTDVDIQTDGGGGYSVGWIDPGEWLQYTIDVSRTATYALNMRVASAGPGGTFHIEVSSSSAKLTFGPISIPDTGGWQNWNTVSAKLTLAAGRQTIRIVFDTATNGIVGNVDSFELVAASPWTAW
jgi:hypothetical protein